MVGNWKKEICAVQPDELQVIADGLYMERKNIHEVQHEPTEGMDAYISWESDSREISISDYNLIKALEDINVEDAVEEAIDAYTLQLIEEGLL